MTTVFVPEIPDVVLKNLLHKFPQLTWTYFGKNLKTLKRLRGLMPAQTEHDCSRELYAVSEEKRKSFVQWIDAISLTGQPSREWLFSVPSVKNPYFSNLFLNVCYFFVFARLLKENRNPGVVFADSPALAQTLAKHFVGPCKFPVVNDKAVGKILFGAWVRSFLRFLRYKKEMLGKFIAAKFVFRSRAKRILAGLKDVVLIRNYISDDFRKDDTGIFERHYFPGLAEYLAKNNFTPVYLSYALNSQNYIVLFRTILASRQRIFVPEEFLTLGDFLHAFLTPFRAQQFRVPQIAIDGYDLSPLVVEEYNANLTESGLLHAVLFSHIGKRIKRAGGKVSALINWAEFQAFEKGLVSGLKKSFPEMKNFASQAFNIPPNHLSLMPSEQDKILNVVPDRILALGSVGKEMAVQFLPEVPVDFSPAFRYQKILSTPVAVNREANNILVLFGYGLENALTTIRILIKLENQLSSFKQVLLKLHPGGYFDRARLLQELGQPLPPNFEFISGRLEDYLDTVALGVCGATGTAVELATRGIPVVMIAETHSLTMNYLAARQEPELWELCFTSDDVASAVKRFHGAFLNDREKLIRKGQQFKQAYFVAPDEKYWKNYLPQDRKEPLYV